MNQNLKEALFCILKSHSKLASEEYKRDPSYNSDHYSYKAKQRKFSSIKLYEEWFKSTDHSHEIYQGGCFFINWLKTKKYLSLGR